MNPPPRQPISQSVQNSHILHRNLSKPPSTVVSSSGLTLTLSTGQKIIDASSGPSVTVLGYTPPPSVLAAITSQLQTLPYIYSGAPLTSPITEELASLLLSSQPRDGLCKAIFVNSGSEATDAAIKLVTQYWHEKGQAHVRRNYISRKQSYHGNTLGALSISGHASRREIYADWLSGNVSFVDPCYAYRGMREGESEAEYVRRLVQQVEDEFLRLGPETVAAFFAETVVGTTLGCVAAVEGYFKGVREVCDKYGALLVLDEIMCGMGKTGTMHAWEQEGISGPDVQMIGKALGGGFVPLSGVLLNRKVFDALASGSQGLAHGHTFQAHPTACAAAVAVQKIIRDDDILANVRLMGQHLETRLRSELAPKRLVGDVRGRGLFWAIEFVQDKATKAPFPPDARFCSRVVDAALELGLNILGNLGATGEFDVEHVIVCPPYIVTPAEIDEIVALLAEAVEIVSMEYLAKRRDSPQGA